MTDLSLVILATRNKLAYYFIKLALKLTCWSEVEGHLKEAQHCQLMYIQFMKDPE